MPVAHSQVRLLGTDINFPAKKLSGQNSPNQNSPGQDLPGQDLPKKGFGGQADINELVGTVM
jgi:hypothetical protein